MIRAMRLRSPTCKDLNMASGRCCGRCTYAIRGYHTDDGEQDDAPSGLPARGINLRAYRRSRVRNTGASRSRSRTEGDGYRTFALGLGEKITEARFGHLVLQYAV